MTTQLETDLKTLQQEALSAIAATTNLDDVEQLRIHYLGKKGQLSQILRAMGKLSAEERPVIGAIANDVKEAVQSQLDERKQSLQNEAIQAQLAAETLDVTMFGVYRPLGRVHPLNSTVDKVLDIFVGLGYTVATGPQVETDYYNFEALNIPADHPARDMQDTSSSVMDDYCEPTLPLSKSVIWKPTNRPFALLPLVGFIVGIRSMQPIQPFSIR